MLAKGRLLGIQFDTLMTDNLYFDISAHAIALAVKLENTFKELGVSFLVPVQSNQLFPILPDGVLARLAEAYVFSEQCRVDESHRAVRFCTSWATKEENVQAPCQDLKALLSSFGLCRSGSFESLPMIF